MKIFTEESPQAVFSGDARPVRVTYQNPDAKAAEVDLRIRLHQISSATTVLIGELPWKKLQVLPGQTVLESASVNFPAVRAETVFLVEWTEGTNKVLGKTEVVVYPTNLLAELKPLCDEKSLGVFDPQNVLKPLLKAADVETFDLEETALEEFHGKLAILGPFQSKTQIRDGLSERVKAAAARGVAFVWIQPPPEKRAAPKPNFYTVPEAKAAVVIVQASEIANLAENPRAQLNLIRFARLALHPEPLRLPFPTAEH